jgi:hypothetical protein
VVSSRDREILRRLAGRVREIAELPEMEARRRRLYALNSLGPDRPVVLCFPEGGWGDLVPDSALECADPGLHGIERRLRRTIFWWDRIGDDNAIEPWFDARWRTADSGYGVEIPYTHGENRGSYVWDPPLKDLDRDLDKLRHREFTVDREKTNRRVELASSVLGGLLPTRIRGPLWWTLGLTWEAIRLVGLENFMIFMMDDPDGVHRLMAWLRDDHAGMIEWAEREGLLTPDNRADYVGSGGVGYTDELPRPGAVEGGPCRLEDHWGFAESQETVGISPAMFGEFVFPYQLPLLERFGLNCYGCCEPVHERLDQILTIPRLRRVSVAPWADQERSAERLGAGYVFSRKPNPSLVCVGFDEDAVRADIRRTLEVAGELPLEIILKDTHTFEGDASRPGRWVGIAREEIERRAALLPRPSPPPS